MLNTVKQRLLQGGESRLLVSATATLLRLPLRDPRAEALAVVVFVPLLLSVALWNGFPIIFYDTGAYLLEGLGRVFLPERSPVYSLMLAYAGGGMSLWCVAILQALATSFVLVQAMRAIAPRLGLGHAAAIGVGLITLTGLPWYVGQIEPDCFAALSALALYLLAFRHAELTSWRNVVLAAVAVLSLAVHPSHLLLGLALVVVLLAYAAVRHFASRIRWPRARIAEPLIACAMGFVLIVAANYQLTGKIFISRSGPVFIFARLLQDGIVMRLLDDTCPAAHYRLCAYKDDLPRTADQWLWNSSSPFFVMNKFAGTADESRRIIWDSLRRYPGLQLKMALLDTARQFVIFRTGDQIEPQEWVLSGPLREFIPAQMDSYLAAHQQRGKLDFRPVNLVHVTAGWLSLLGLAAALWICARARDAQSTIFATVIVLSLLLNAAICGVLSNPHNRYQSRMIWLTPCALALIAGDRKKFALRGVAESGS